VRQLDRGSLIDLAPLAEAAEVAPAVISALGVVDRPTRADR
jgi:predicted ATPase